MKKFLLTALVLISFGAHASEHMMQAWADYKYRQAVKERREAHRDFYKSHKLLLIFSSRCGHCKRFAPKITRWVEANGAKLRAVSLDGRGLPNIPHFEAPEESMLRTAYSGSPRVTPALFIINEETSAIYPVVYGNEEYRTLSVKIDGLIPKIQRFELEGGRNE